MNELGVTDSLYGRDWTPSFIGGKGDSLKAKAHNPFDFYFGLTVRDPPASASGVTEDTTMTNSIFN